MTPNLGGLMTSPKPPMRYAKPAPSTSRPAQKGSNQRVRRDVLVQCDRCTVWGTARFNGFALTEHSLAADRDRHRICGGRLVAFDTRGGDGT